MAIIMGLKPTQRPTATVRPCISESPLKSTLQAYVNIDHYGEYGMSELQLYFTWCHHLH